MNETRQGRRGQARRARRKRDRIEQNRKRDGREKSRDNASTEFISRHDHDPKTPQCRCGSKGDDRDG
jgi:hypothetical protein